MSFHPTMPYGTDEWHRSMRATLPEGPEFSYPPKNRENFEEFASHYAPENRVSAVLHALYLVQDQQGYISNNAVRHVAQVIGCTTAPTVPGHDRRRWRRTFRALRPRVASRPNTSRPRGSR